MFGIRKPPEDLTDLEEAISELISEMREFDAETEEYTAAAANLKVLMEARQIEKSIEQSWYPSADAVALVAGNLLGIIAILSFEKANVITSKSLNFVLKPKI